MVVNNTKCMLFYYLFLNKQTDWKQKWRKFGLDFFVIVKKKKEKKIYSL